MSCIQVYVSESTSRSNLDVKIVPAIQEGYVTKIVKDEDEKSRIYNFLEEISINVAINQEGKLQQKE